MTLFTSTSDYVCGWSTDSCCSTLEAVDEEIAQRAVNAAAEILNGLSGRQFGVCEHVVRPCRLQCGNSLSAQFGWRWTPVQQGGQWINVSCGPCGGDSCGCTRVCEVLLPGPVESVTKVMLDGVDLDSDSYRLDNRRMLVRVDGDCWPTCQDMAKAPTEEGTWEVTYQRGRPLPEAGRFALGEFACELAKACINDNTCKLPGRVTSVSRQGVSFAVLDPLAFLENGKTGIYAVDAWLRTVNPKARTRGAMVYSPDFPTGRVTS